MSKIVIGRYPEGVTLNPERLRDPSQPASPNNVMLRSMAGATPENSYADE